MELMNKYYNFSITEDQKEISITSIDGKNHVIAFFNFEDKEGLISKNMVDGVQYKSFKRWIKGLMIHRDLDLSVEIDLVKFEANGILQMIKEELSEVEQIKIESQQVINSINTETLENQKESLEAVSTQLDKVYQAIEKNINNEKIRLQLRDVENELKWHYGSLDEMVGETEDSTVLDLTVVNFNNINELIPFISNWNKLSQNVQESILKANNFYFFGSSLMLYVECQAIAEGFITQIKDNNIIINSIGFKDGLQWNEYQNEEQQQTEKKKVTHNEYENICKKLASRIYVKDETKITMKEYDQMLDNYEILPFEINTDNEELKKVINTYADNESIEDTRTVYRGSIDKSILYNLLNNSEGYKDLYIEYYQMIICNDKLKVILTYCEGDFIAEVYNSESEYNEGIEITKKFIDEM